MRRKAILIESSKVKGQTELPGARVDIKNWQNYLKSDLGGAWVDSEILKLSQPFTSDVETELNATSAFDYVFVAFSGHGCEGAIVLNEYFTSYSITKLKPKCGRGALIVDSCRGVSDEEAYAVRAKRAFANESMDTAFAMNALAGRATELSTATLRAAPKSHRSSWEASLTKSGIGIVEMQSCSKGEAAGEDPNAGGFYTSLLLQGATTWEHTNTGVFTTKDAHDYAKGMLPSQQTPEYKPLTLAFPFGVSV